MSILTEIERIKKAKESIINTLKANDIQIKETATIDEVDMVMNDVPILDTSDATATAEDILKDKIAYVNGEKIIGTSKGNLSKDNPIEMDDINGNVQIQLISKNILDLTSLKRFDAYDCEYKLINNTGMRVTLWNTAPHVPVRFVAFNLEPYKGKTLTFSAYAKSSKNNSAMLLMALCNSNGGNRSGVVFSEETTNGQLSITIQIPEVLNTDTSYLCLMIYGRRAADGSGSGTYVDYTNMQIELGDAMTDFSPYNNKTISSDTITKGDKVIISLV